MPELALTSFMQGLGFTMGEIFKMLLLVGFSFIFQGLLIWRARKYIKALYFKMMDTMSSVTAVSATLETHVVQSNERQIESNRKHEEQSNEIKVLAEQIKKNNELNARQFTEVAHQVRYLYTKLQISAPVENEESDNKH